MASTVTIVDSTTACFTAEELLNLDTETNFELVDGRLVEKPMGLRSDHVSAQLIALLREFIRPRHLGYLTTGQAGYQCFSHKPQQVRKPDVSLILKDRLPEMPDGWIPIRPDFACEIISPGDEFSHIIGRTSDFVRAGTPVVWIVDPENRAVFRCEPQGHYRMLTGESKLTIEPALPGFSCTVDDLMAV